MIGFKIIITFFYIITSSQTVFSQDKFVSHKKLFSFGTVADIQYANAETKGNRNYRGSLNKLEKCINEFNRHNLAFVVTLGDMIDRDYISFNKPLAILKKSKAPVYNVVGNHDFAVEDKFKSNVKQRLGNRRGYSSFKVGDFTFIVLDGTDLSTLAYTEGSREFNKGMVKYKELEKEGFNNAFTWNGGIGHIQLKWLGNQLEKASFANRKVIIFCHWPLLPEGYTHLWGNREVLQLLNLHNCVVAWIAGHRHEGSYKNVGYIHHLTLKSIVEAKSETSCGIIEVYPGKLLLKGYGDQEDQTFEISK